MLSWASIESDLWGDMEVWVESDGDNGWVCQGGREGVWMSVLLGGVVVVVGGGGGVIVVVVVAETSLSSG